MRIFVSESFYPQLEQYREECLRSLNAPRSALHLEVSKADTNQLQELVEAIIPLTDVIVPLKDLMSLPKLGTHTLRGLCRGSWKALLQLDLQAKVGIVALIYHDRDLRNLSQIELLERVRHEMANWQAFQRQISPTAP